MVNDSDLIAVVLELADGVTTKKTGPADDYDVHMLLPFAARRVKHWLR